jgi:hypothetical protein
MPKRSIVRNGVPIRTYRSRVSLADRIKSVEATVSAIEAMPPALGSKWRAGMLRYYGAVLKELKAYGTRSGEPK